MIGSEEADSVFVFVNGRILPYPPVRGRACDFDVEDLYVMLLPFNPPLQLAGLTKSISASWLVIMKEAIEATSWNVKFPTMKEFLALHNEGWDDEAFVKARFEEEGFEDVEVIAVQRETSLTVSEFMEVGEGMIPIVTGAFWTPEQREMYEAKAPVVIREYLEEKFGAEGVVRMDPVAVLAVGRKP